MHVKFAVLPKMAVMENQLMVFPEIALHSDAMVWLVAVVTVIQWEPR